MKMEVNQFYNKFLEKMDKMLDDDVLLGKENKDELESGTFTFLFNVVAYELAKDNELGIIPENPTEIGGKTDILFCSKDRKQNFIEVEHENPQWNKKKNEDAIRKSLNNLSSSQANVKVLITYTMNNFNEDELINFCNQYLSNNSNISEIYLFYAPDDFDYAKKKFKIQKLIQVL